MDILKTLQRRFRYFLGSLLTTVVLVQGAWGADLYSRTEQLQAAFFHKFLGFIQWDAPERTGRPAKLCVFGDSPFPALLEELVTLNAEDVTVASVTDVSSAASCSLLFIPKTNAAKLSGILTTLSGSGVVTVSDMPEFARNGGVIQFVEDESRVRFLINRDAAESQGVRLSSQLLALAKKEV